MTKKLEQAQDVLLTKINQICSKFGLNDMMAQLYAILYLSGKPLSLDDMVERLKISKGSASINIRALERYGAVKRVWVRGSRKDYYEAEFNISKVIIDRFKGMAQNRLTEVEDMISSSYQVLDSAELQNGEDDEELKAFREKMGKLKSLYDQAKTLFDLFNASFLDGMLNNKNADTEIPVQK